MIIAEYGNSINITDRNMTFAGTMKAFQSYLTGQRRYLRREPVEWCENDDERRGWWDALHYDAAADLDCERGTDWQG